MLIFLGISHGTQPSPGKRCEADRRWRVFRKIHSKENKIQSAAWDLHILWSSTSPLLIRTVLLLLASFFSSFYIGPHATRLSVPHPPATPSETLCVHRVCGSLTAEELSQTASEYRCVINIDVPLGKGIAFIKMAMLDEAWHAIDGLDGSIVHARKLNVKFSNPPSKHILQISMCSYHRHFFCTRNHGHTYPDRMHRNFYTRWETHRCTYLFALILELIQPADPDFVADCILCVLVPAHPIHHLKYPFSLHFAIY